MLHITKLWIFCAISSLATNGIFDWWTNFNPVKTKAHVNNNWKFSPFLTENTTLHHYKAQMVNAVWGNIAVHTEDHTSLHPGTSNSYFCACKVLNTLVYIKVLNTFSNLMTSSIRKITLCELIVYRLLAAGCGTRAWLPGSSAGCVPRATVGGVTSNGKWGQRVVVSPLHMFVSLSTSIPQRGGGTGAIHHTDWLKYCAAIHVTCCLNLWFTW
jgi:hypothetical protein